MASGSASSGSPSLVAAQSAVPWHRGVATSASIFARSVGSAVGVAAFGAVANTVVRDRLGGAPPDLEPLPRGVLAPALGAVFVAAAAVSVVMFLGSWVMPRVVEEAPVDRAG